MWQIRRLDGVLTLGAHWTPVSGRTGSRRVTRREQHGQLMGSQTLAGNVRGRPPWKMPPRKTLVAQPKSLAVVHQHLQCRASAIAKDEDRAGEWILLELFAAEPRQTVDATPEIGRRHGHQDLHLRGDLQHHSAFPKRRARISRSAVS